MERYFLISMIKSLFILISLIFSVNINADTSLNASGSLIWDSKNRFYLAKNEVVFKNKTFIAYSDEMKAQYIEQDNQEIFNIVELFGNVKIELEEEVFQGDYAIYTKEDNIIKLIGNVSISSPSRLLNGYELIADIDNNTRTLNSDDKESIVEVLLD